MYFPTYLVCQKKRYKKFSKKRPLLGLPSEKAMATHSSTLAWKIPWVEEPGGLQSVGLWRVGHDWETSLSLFTFMHWRRKWQPTRVLSWRIPGTGEPGGLPYIGSHRVRHNWSNLVVAAAAAGLPGSSGLDFTLPVQRTWVGFLVRELELNAATKIQCSQMNK